MTPAIDPWRAGDRLGADSAAADRFRIEGSPIDAAVAIAAQPAPDGTTATAWLTVWERIREDIGGHCFGSATPWQERLWPAFRRGTSHGGATARWRRSRTGTSTRLLAGGTGYVISGTPSMVDLVVQSFRAP